MPLEFQSKSHGPIAFGFFNIETDMLLLDRYFFFCDRLLRCLVGNGRFPEARKTGFACEGYHIADPADIGDLMGAISGTRHTGFIGALYRKFPFPKKQKTSNRTLKGIEQEPRWKPW